MTAMVLITKKWVSLICAEAGQGTFFALRAFASHGCAIRKDHETTHDGEKTTRTTTKRNENTKTAVQGTGPPLVLVRPAVHGGLDLLYTPPPPLWSFEPILGGDLQNGTWDAR